MIRLLNLIFLISSLNVLSQEIDSTLLKAYKYTYDNMEEKQKDYEVKRNFLSANVMFYDKVGSLAANYFYTYYILSKPELGSITLNKHLNEAIISISSGIASAEVNYGQNRTGNGIGLKFF